MYLTKPELTQWANDYCLRAAGKDFIESYNVFIDCCLESNPPHVMELKAFRCVNARKALGERSFTSVAVSDYAALYKGAVIASRRGSIAFVENLLENASGQDLKLNIYGPTPVLKAIRVEPKRICTKVDFYSVLSKFFEVPFVEPTKEEVQTTVLQKLSTLITKHFK